LRCGVFEPASETEDRKREEDRDNQVEAVEEHELWILREVLHLGVVRREVAAAGDPADVRPPESMHVRRVGILLFIAVLVVVAGGGGRPEAAAVHGRAGPARGQNWGEAGRAVRLLREVGGRK